MIEWVSDFNRVISIVISAVFFFAFIIALVRIVGKRATSQLNNFDWIINIAVGSLAASGILLEDVRILDAAIAIAVLAALQMLTTWAVLKYDFASKVIKAQPTLLTHKGEFLRDAMRKARISEEEICSTLRSHGMHDIADANWVILETNGELTVIPKADVDLPEIGTMGGVEKPKDLKC